MRYQSRASDLLGVFRAKKRLWDSDKSQSGNQKARIWKGGNVVGLLRNAGRKRIAIQDAIAGFVVLVDEPQPAGQPRFFN